MITNPILKWKKEGWLRDATLIMMSVDDYESYLKMEEGRMIARCYLNNDECRWLRILS